VEPPLPPCPSPPCPPELVDVVLVVPVDVPVEVPDGSSVVSSLQAAMVMQKSPTVMM
jgi:hypothetical protein